MLKLSSSIGAELFQNLSKTCKTQRIQNLWGYVAIAFNQVDAIRLAQVGPDRLCAEWLLKNGGGVRFKQLPNRLVTDYNSLPPESQKLSIQVADATNSSVMKIGLEHFKDCNCIETVIIDKCKHLEADGLGGLTHLKKTLRRLTISSCDNLGDQSFDCLCELTNLSCLTLGNLKYVKSLDDIVKKLRAALPDCKINSN